MTRRRKAPEGWPFRVYASWGPRVWSVFYHPLGQPRIYLYREKPETHPRAQVKRLALAKFGEIMGDQVSAMDTFAKLWRGYRDWQDSLPASSPWRKADSTLASDLSHIRRPLEVFGAMHPDMIGAGNLKKYQDMRAVPVANHELAIMSAVFRWGVEREYCLTNPVPKVRKIPTTAATRVVTLEEIEAVLPVAKEQGRQAVIQVAAAMVAFLATKRSVEVLRLERKHVTDAGVLFSASKRRAGQAEAFVQIEWSPTLRAAIDLALDASRLDLCRWVFPARGGSNYTKSGWGSSWARLMAKCKKRDPSFQPFTLKDCRPGGATAKVARGDTDTVTALQHKSGRMLAKHYDRTTIKKATPAA